VAADLTLLGFAGSLRRDSWNRSLLSAFVRHAPEGTTISSYPLGDIPLYNADYDGDRRPEVVRAMASAATSADGLLFVTPEYNWGVPAVTKNVIDWLSRPMREGPIWNKPMAIATIGPGPGGGRHMLGHLIETLGVLSPNLFPAPLALAGVSDQLLTLDGTIVDADLGRRVEEWLIDVCSHVRATAASS
jgi:chromate reductase, NAD(P)H dehydrogenase (quinone)